jgi:hypothetical protein
MLAAAGDVLFVVQIQPDCFLNKICIFQGLEYLIDTQLRKVWVSRPDKRKRGLSLCCPVCFRVVRPLIPNQIVAR